MRLSLMVACISLLVLQGCASSKHSPAPEAGNAAPESVSEQTSGQRPAWVDATPDTSSGEFMGMGGAKLESEARSAAQRDALSQFARHLGAEVVSGSRIETSSRYSETRAENASIERTAFTGVDAQGFIQGAETEVYTHKRGEGQYAAYARLSVPEEVLHEASEAIERQHKAKLQRQADALKILRKQQMRRASGHEPDIVFGKAQGQAGANIHQSGSREEARHEAMEKARHRAEIKLGRQIHGQRQSVSSSSSGDEQHTTTSSVSQGRFSSEILAERSWELDGNIHATVTLLGWSANSEEES